MTAYITGIGWVFPESYGNRKSNHKKNLIKNKLPDLPRNKVLKEPYKPYGRMDFFSKLGFAAISYALEDADLEDEKEKNNTGIIASTVMGCLDTDVRYYDTVRKENGSCASPALFAYTLPNCFLGEASIYYGMTGENFILSEKRTNGTKGMLMALSLLDSGISNRVLCGICDAELRANTELTGQVTPGSLFFVLEKKLRKNVFCYGQIDCNRYKNTLLFNKEDTRDLLDLVGMCPSLDSLSRSETDKIGD